MPELEEKFEEPIQYNISDAFVLLKAFRHIPEILSEKDPVTRYYELTVNLIIPAVHFFPIYANYFGNGL